MRSSLKPSSNDRRGVGIEEIRMAKFKSADEHILVGAKIETDVRKQNLLIAWGNCYAYLTGDDIAQIEPVLHRAIGRKWVDATRINWTGSAP